MKPKRTNRKKTNWKRWDSAYLRQGPVT